MGSCWERPRLAGNAFRISTADILHPCRRDAGAPSNRALKGPAKFISAAMRPMKPIEYSQIQ
jgi:hypothetical protein